MKVEFISTEFVGDTTHIAYKTLKEDGSLLSSATLIADGQLSDEQAIEYLQANSDNLVVDEEPNEVSPEEIEAREEAQSEVAQIGEDAELELVTDEE